MDDVPVPSPASGQALVKVAATSVNLSDWECLRGSPAPPALTFAEASTIPQAGAIARA
jgi:NADPH:quinone reductase-like Zn-dependent oxidoreductase